MVDIAEAFRRAKGWTSGISAPSRASTRASSARMATPETAGSELVIIPAATRASRACRATTCSTPTPASSSRSRRDQEVVANAIVIVVSNPLDVMCWWPGSHRLPRERCSAWRACSTRRAIALPRVGARRLRTRHPGDGARRPWRHDGSASRTRPSAASPHASRWTFEAGRHCSTHRGQRRRDREVSQDRIGMSTRRRRRGTDGGAIVFDQRRNLPCAAWLEGVHGMSGLFLGVPCNSAARFSRR